MAYNIGLITDFWRMVVAPSRSRTWLVGALVDLDYFLRDGFAALLVQRHLANRADVGFRFARAFSITADTSDRSSPDHDVLLLGRSRAFVGSVLSTAARALSGRFKGEFLDDRRGTTADSIAYGRRLFRRIDFDTVPPGERRTQVDFAVLQILTVETGATARRYVGIAGVSGFGTLCLTLILADPVRRTRLVEEVRALMPPEAADGWTDDYFECCVRVSVPDEAHLANVLNEGGIDFEVAAVAGSGGFRLRPDELELKLRPSADARRGGQVEVRGAEPVALSAKQFGLLRLLVEESPRSRSALFDILGFEHGTDAEEALASGRLSKMVHDLNVKLKQLPPLQGQAPIASEHRGRELLYLLKGVRGTVVTP